MAAVAILDNSE